MDKKVSKEKRWEGNAGCAGEDSERDLGLEALEALGCGFGCGL